LQKYYGFDFTKPIELSQKEKLFNKYISIHIRRRFNHFEGKTISSQVLINILKKKLKKRLSQRQIDRGTHL